MARRQRGLPNNSLLGAEFDRKISRAGNAGPVGTAKARPFVVACDPLTCAKQRPKQRKDERGDETRWHISFSMLFDLFRLWRPTIPDGKHLRHLTFLLTSSRRQTLTRYG